MDLGLKKEYTSFFEKERHYYTKKWVNSPETSKKRKGQEKKGKGMTKTITDHRRKKAT